MRRDARFWRNVALITLVHVLALIALLRWAGASKIESAQEITWLSANEDTSASIDSPKPEETPTPEKPALPEENQSVPAPAKSEIQLPTATPHPTPSASTTPKPSPKASPKPSPKKKTSPKPSPSPEKKKSKPQATSAKEKENTKKLAKNELKNLKRNWAKQLQKMEAPLVAGRRRTPVPLQQTPVGTATCCTTAFIANGHSRLPWLRAAQSFLPWQESESNKTAAFPISKLCGLPGMS